jgi:hypothetical protein
LKLLWWRWAGQGRGRGRGRVIDQVKILGSMLGKVSIEIVGDGHAGGEKIPMRTRAGWRLCKDHDEIEGLVAAGQSWC